MNTSRPKTWLIWIGGAALLLATLIDTLAMLGRALQLPLVGSIEIVQATVLFAASAGLVVATLAGAHARVRLVLDRLPPNWRGNVERLHAVAAALFYAALLAGSLWIGIDLWSGHEESEVLRIPYRPLRVVITLVLVVLLVQSLLRLFRREPE